MRSQLLHLTLVIRGRLSIARTETERRRLVHSVTQVGRAQLLAFGVVDDHAHFALRSPWAGVTARSLAHRIRGLRPDLELKTPHIEPIGSRRYLKRVVKYIIEQPRHHGLAVPAPIWSGSCFQDLVGARLLPQFDRTRLVEELPRLRLRELFEHLDLGSEPLRPASRAELRAAGPLRLASLASRVFAVSPALASQTLPSIRARALAVQACHFAGFPNAAIVGCVGASARTVRRLAAGAPSPSALRALQIQLALDERVRSRAWDSGAVQEPASPSSSRPKPWRRVGS
ncbi:MAG: transposase [Planctomycetota bacterium]